MHRFSAYGDGRELPLTDAYASRAITLPLFPHMEAGALETVIDALADALG